MRRLSFLSLVCLVLLVAPRAAPAQQVYTPIALPPLVLTGQLAAITTTTAYNTGTAIAIPPPVNSVTPGASIYRASVSLILTAQGSAGTISATIGCNNGTIVVNQTSGTVTTTAAVGSEVDATFVCFAGPATNITYATTFTGVTGAPAYTLRVRLEWVP